MRKKSSISNIIQWWGIIFLLAVGGGLIVLDMAVSYRDFHAQAERIRTEYIDRQKQIVKLEVDRVVAMINYQKSLSEEVTRKQIQSRVYEAYAIAENIYRQNKSDKSEAEIQRMILAALRPIRYAEGRGYYFITRVDGVEILFADKPEMEGLNLLDMQDAQGQFVIKDLIAIARQSGEGNYEYHWTKPGAEGNDFKKISHVKLFEPYGWVIGTGLYVNDVEGQIREKLMGQINELRFGTNGYFFVDSWQGVSLAHGLQPDIIGTDMWETEDNRGNKTTQMLIAAAKKAEGGYVSYWWRKSPAGGEHLKIAYVKGIPSWEILVGTGFYLDDIENDIAVMQSKLNQQIKRKMSFFVLVTAGIVALFLLLFNCLNRRLKNDVNLFLSFFNRAAHSDEAIDRNMVQFVELDQMAKDANRMLQDKKQVQQKLVDEREALRQSEIKYHDLVENSPDIRYQADLKGRLVFISQSAEKFSGYTVGELIGRKITDFYVNQERRKDLLSRLQKNDYVNDFIAQLKCKDGSTRWASANITFRKDRNGNILGVEGVVRDVTERMEAEEALKEMYSIINQSPTVVLIWKNEVGWPVTYVSENVKSVFGYTAEELLSGAVSYASLIHPDDIEKIIADVASYNSSEKGNHITQEYRIIAKDGSVVWLDHRTLIQRDASGKITNYQGIVLDTTERKQAEEALRQSENKFRAMMESMSDPVYICSSNYQVEYMNPAMIKRTGRNATGELCYQALHDFDEPCPWCRWKNMSHGEYFELDIVSPKDKHSYHISHSPVVNEDGSISSMVVFRDTTEFKKLEEQLFQFQKLESIGNLAGGVAHDFNNILTVINGYAQIVQMKLEEGSKLQHDVRELAKAGERAANLTRQLLGFSRKQMIMPRTVNVNQVITEMGKMLKRLISEDIHLETSLDVNVDPIYADPGQLEQILMNLVINARDAVNNQPETAEKVIKISTSQVFLDEDYVVDHQDSSTGWYMELQVEDNGCGMTEEVRKHIFEPFYTTKAVGQGTGMGLATVYGIVKQNNGSIYAYSEPGQGSTFKVYWPIMAVETVEDVPEEPEPARDGSEVILLAEDDPQIREIISLQLRQVGYTVIEAENGREALEKAENYQGNIDLLFTDAVMPIMGGKELSEKIKAIYPHLPVLFASGYNDNGIHQDIIDLAGNRFINKPYNIQDIMARIRRLLDEKKS